MANPQIPQGTLNRLLATVVFSDNAGLNVTAPYLGKNGIHLVLDGKSAESLPTMTGTVISPEPYMMGTATMDLLKSQAFADRYKQQMETNSSIGNGTIWPDSTTLSPFNIFNAVITGVRDLPFNGQSAEFAVSIEFYYQVNSNLYGG